MTPKDRGLSAEQVRKQLDASLKRLRTDHVDLYQCHRYDAQTPLSETMEALTRAVSAGKVRYLGFSEWTPAQIKESLALPGEKFVSSQPQYSLLQRRIEAEVIPLCEANGIGQIVWSPLAQGVLTGKYKPGHEPPADSRAASDKMGGFLGDEWLNERVLSAVQKLGPIARQAGLSMSQLALAWVLRQPNVASAIIGATKPEQIVDNAGASGVKLSPDTLAAANQALAGIS
jgi:aryl-alcohol dehydrogenase-like predicted oxidoreductase